MKKIISLLVTLLIICSLFVFSASAANSAIISLSAENVVIGDKVNVTVKLIGDQPMYALDFKLGYDATKFAHEGTAGIIHTIDPALSGETVKTYTFTLTSIATGGGYIKVYDDFYSPDGINDVSFGGASVNVTVKDVELSGNANLSALTLSAGTLSPNFTAGKTEYTVSVPYETDKITLYTKLSDAKAKVALSSNPTNLNVGANTIKVTVTAQNGSQKIYTVVVTRREQGATDTQPDNPTPENPYQTVISGKNYEIVTTIPEASYLQGFTLSSAEWNGNQVPVLRDNDSIFTVYYLREKDATEIAPYIYNAELETFESLKHQTFNNKLYIFTDFPEDVKLPNDYYSTYTQIGNYSVKVYMDSNTQMADFAYAYCYSNGDFGLYRYDSKEGTIQRFPDIHLVATQNGVTPERDNFATRFAALSTNGKILLIAMLIAALCVVALIVFIIVMAIQKFYNKQEFSTESQDFSFDDVTIVGENDISSSSK
ncbi:MAG: cadherin-like beta sandwich domain-containing protein [Clostridia bacterium]|nr:cadherin-like beta sandwich domain-containing protein [Clostridia bacterium]